MRACACCWGHHAGQRWRSLELLGNSGPSPTILSLRRSGDTCSQGASLLRLEPRIAAGSWLGWQPLGCLCPRFSWRLSNSRGGARLIRQLQVFPSCPQQDALDMMQRWSARVLHQVTACFKVIRFALTRPDFDLQRSLPACNTKASQRARPWASMHVQIHEQLHKVSMPSSCPWRQRWVLRMSE